MLQLKHEPEDAKEIDQRSKITFNISCKLDLCNYLHTSMTYSYIMDSFLGQFCSISRMFALRVMRSRIPMMLT